MVEFTLYEIEKDGIIAKVVADQEGKIQCILPLSSQVNYKGKPIYQSIFSKEGKVWVTLPAEKESNALSFAATLLEIKPLSPDISQKISDYYQDAVEQIRQECEGRSNAVRIIEKHYDSEIKKLKEEKERGIKELIVHSDQTIQQLEPVYRLEELVKAVS